MVGGKIIRAIIFIIVLTFVYSVFAQNGTVTISGLVKDSESGEVLIGTNILLYKAPLTDESNYLRGTSSNRYGFYSIPRLECEDYIMVVSNIGYETKQIKISCKIKSGTISNNIELVPKDIRLRELIISGQRQNVSTTSEVNISPKFLSMLPTSSGDIEIFKALQYVPGITAASEISSGLYIRGGSSDQTLILVDGMLVYNPSHLGNFGSTFNTNAIHDLRVIKGAYPAEYGGKLSSVLDIKLKAGTKEDHKNSLAVGVINSSLSIEGPLEDKGSYMLTGRGMYFDKIQELLNKDSGTPNYHYYDLNGKLTYILSDNNSLSLSAYFSTDNITSPSSTNDLNYEIEWQNAAINLNFLQITSQSLLTNSNVSIINYKFKSVIDDGLSGTGSNDYFSYSDLYDFILKKNYEYNWKENHTLKAGAELSLHKYELALNDQYSDSFERNPEMRESFFNAQLDVYFQNESEFWNSLKTNAGVRFSYLLKGKYFAIEPRFSLFYSLSKNFQLKLGYALTHQFLHMISKEDVSLPTDFWYPSTETLKPSRSNQYIGGIDFNSDGGEYKISIDTYYRDMEDIYEFKDNVRFDFKEDIEKLLTSGQGEAYGAEFFLNKRSGKLTGWIGYNLSWTRRKFKEINAGKIYYPRYDRRHDVSVVLAYNFSESFSAGVTWIYSTGQGITLPSGQYYFETTGLSGKGDVFINYEQRNNYRMPDYHKMDINLNYKFFFNDFLMEAYVSLYNVYNRMNPFAQYITKVADSENAEREKLIMKRITLFPFVPAFGIKIQF